MPLFINAFLLRYESFIIFRENVLSDSGRDPCICKTIIFQRQIERKDYGDGKIDEEIEGRWTFSVEEKLESDQYNADFVKEIDHGDSKLL